MSINKDVLIAALAQADVVDVVALDMGHRPRGLAYRQSVESLAQTYLEEQSKYWPELIESGLVAPPSPEKIAAMADHFDRVYISGTLPFASGDLPNELVIGAVYARYSDANSNPRSLNQQLANALRGASGHRVFVPWEYVFADAATTGTNGNRRGYQLLKQVIPRTTFPIGTVFIDELGRASRDQIESLSLGRLIETSGKRLVGVTDGFDSNNSMSKMMLSFYAMIHELFVDQLREKVDRGMSDAFKQGKPLYMPGFGYTLVPVLGDDGNPVLAGDGKVIQHAVIVEEEATQVRRMFSLFIKDRFSPQRISRLFNTEQIGSRAWTSTQVRNMLDRPIYHGKEAWKKTKREVDPQTGAIKIVNVPEEAWQWRDMPHLRIVDEQTWQAAQDRLAELSRAYNPKDKTLTRAEANPKRLFTLICASCGGQMWCTRGGDRQVVRCNRGKDGTGGCTGQASKTLKQIEESLLNHILEQFWSEDFVDQLLLAVNAALAGFAIEPVVDVVPLRAQLAKKESSRDRILRRLEKVDDDTLMDQVLNAVGKLEKEIVEIKQAIQRATSDRGPVTPIGREDLVGIIGSLRDLLYEDVSAAGPVLAALTGPVKLSQGEPLPGKRRPQWTAEFTMNHAKVFVEIARQRNCPTTDTWEFLSNRSWTIGETASVDIRMISNAERIAKSAAEMVLAGSTHEMAAVALMADKETVDTAMRHWEAGRRCYLPPKDLSFRRTLPMSKVDKLADQIVQLVDVEGMSFVDVATKLDTSPKVVSRAYKQSKLEQTVSLAKRGKRLPMRTRLKLPAEVHARIRELLLVGGMSYRQIAREVGCDHHAVSDAHKRMKKQSAA